MCFGNCDRSGMDLCRWENLFVETLLTKGSGKVQIAIIPVKKVMDVLKRVLKE